MALDKDQWQQARQQWERDDGMSLADVADMLGVSRPAVTQHAAKHNWRRASTPVAREELAQAVVDTIAHVAGRTELLDAADAALDLTVATRVAVVRQHREDWRQHRDLYPPEVLAGNAVASARAKRHAETLVLRQRGESVAFGLVEFTGRSTDAPLVEAVDINNPPDDPHATYIAGLLERLEAHGHVSEAPQLPGVADTSPKIENAPGELLVQDVEAKPCAT
ncbi:hypothetical protein WKW79_13675 [Variovorax robiniae]|uniref:Uncharacterized protein n=1 Tax=Variovorax robiniae TaxID=1836199 RepID=A0ABU8X726_9BURK